jgi:hypothetical protein
MLLALVVGLIVISVLVLVGILGYLIEKSTGNADRKAEEKGA